MVNEIAIAYELRESCRSLLRYDGIDKDRVRTAVEQIRDIVDVWLNAEQNDELDTKFCNNCVEMKEKLKVMKRCFIENLRT